MRITNMRKRSARLNRARAAFALLSIAAWFSLSNHCALGAITRPVETGVETSECPMHSAPAKKKPAAKLPCCKDLRAVAAKAAANTLPAPIRFVGAREYAVEIFVSPPRLAIAVDGLDTGPPGRFSFAESVLQQSILAHAPPLS
jgi:hypothetical protein